MEIKVMKNATRLYVSTFGTIMALAGIEHGIGEILQGNVAPSSVMIQSWPESEFFLSLSGEPAMTVIPNLLAAGILTVIASLALLIWSILFVHRKNGGWVMILLSLAMLLVGGGIFPPIFGILIGATAIRMNKPGSSPSNYGAEKSRRLLATLWPWSYTLCIFAWFALLPGIPILEYFFGVENPVIVLVILVFALGSLLLNIFSSFAFDLQRQVGMIA
jgi:hypothetical protein